jgi:hypothetical protein
VGLGEIADEKPIQRLELLADEDPSSDVRTAAGKAVEQIRARARSKRGAEKK